MEASRSQEDTERTCRAYRLPCVADTAGEQKTPARGGGCVVIWTPVEWLTKPFNPSGCEQEQNGFRTWS